jgi:phosphatidylglycerophosphatase A
MSAGRIKAGGPETETRSSVIRESRKIKESQSLPPPLRAWHPASIIATGAGAGRLPVAPGTWTSLLCLPAAWFIATLAGREGFALVILLALIAGIWASGLMERRNGVTDPGYIVIDEVVGQWIAVWLIEPDIILYTVGFILFRLADILKPWPVSRAERLPGGYGVMMDDVLAGLYAAAGVYLVSIWL